MKSGRNLLAGLLVMTCAAVLAAQPTTQNSDDESFHAIKTASGNAKSKITAVKFKVTTPRWRLTIKTEPEESKPNSPGPSFIRIGLLAEKLRNVDGNVANWEHVMLICDGRAGNSGTKIFENGPTDSKDGKWFEVTIVGQNAKYEVTAEDQSPDDKPKSKPKSKKKKDD